MTTENKTTLTNYFIKNDAAWKHYADKDNLLKYVSPVGGVSLDPQTANIEYRPLPFYKNSIMLRVNPSRYDDQPDYFFFIKSGENLVHLDGGSDKIYEVNAEEKFKPEPETVLDYLKFFCLFLTAEEGSFYLLEGKESEFLEGRSNLDRDRVLKNYTGPVVTYDAENKLYRISARVLHGSAYYDSEFSVYEDGAIVMEDDSFHLRA